jgi:hypothetical protein
VDLGADDLRADIELDVHLRLALPLVNGRRVRVLERHVLHILGDHPDLRQSVGSALRLLASAVRAFLFGHLCKSSETLWKIAALRSVERAVGDAPGRVAGGPARRNIRNPRSFQGLRI